MRFIRNGRKSLKLIKAISPIKYGSEAIDYIPNANNDAFSVDQDTTFSGSLIVNDTASQDGGNIWSLLAQATSGVAVVSSNGSFTYAPNIGFSGADSFTYKITDADGDENTATVSMTVNEVVVTPNVAPVASNISVSVNQDSSVEIPIVATDSDGSVDYAATAVTGGPSHGTRSINPATGAITYIPTTNYYGVDEIRYTVADNEGLVSNEYIISINVIEAVVVVPADVAQSLVVGETLYAGMNGADVSQALTIGETLYAGQDAPAVVAGSIPFGDIPALQALGLLPTYEKRATAPTVDTDIIWIGTGGDRPEISLLPDDHAGYIAGHDLDLQLMLDTADQPMSEAWSHGHYPNLYWFPFLMTGDSKYVALMETQYKATCDKISRPYDQLAWKSQAGRYLAWPLRILGQLATLQAYGHTSDSVYIDSLNYSANYYTDYAITNANSNVNDRWRVVVPSAVAYKSYGLVGWMETMVGLSLNYLVQLGHDNFRQLAEWHFVQLERRIEHWGWKGLDADSLFFYARAVDLGEEHLVTDYNPAKEWGAPDNETVAETMARVTPYTKQRMDNPNFIALPDDQLIPSDQPLGGTVAGIYTYHNRAESAYHWAALAAKNGISGAAQTADDIYAKLEQRGIGTLEQKNMPLGRPFVSSLPAIVNDEWTPVHDGDGNVLAESFGQLPIESEGSLRFLKIAGLDPVAQLDAAITATGFNLSTQTFGNSGSSSRNTFTAYAGHVYDPVSKCAYRAWNGGHADSSLNIVDKFDVNKLVYELVVGPSNPDAPGLEWSQAYRDTGKGRAGDPQNGVPRDHGSFTPYVDGTIYTDEDGDAQWNRTYQLPDGRPTSSHNYAGTMFFNGEIITVRNVRSSYNLNTGQFSVSDWSDYLGHLRPDVNHWMFPSNGAFYGVMNRANDYYRFYKISDPTSSVVERMPGAPEGVYFVGEHSLVQLDETRICAINSTQKYAVFDTSTELWGPAIDITGDTPSYTTVQELQVGISIPEWGGAGKVLRQFTYSSMRGDWYLLDLATNVQTAVTFAGYDAGSPWLTSNKAFRVEVGGITAIIYINVTSVLSEVYIMRIA